MNNKVIHNDSQMQKGVTDLKGDYCLEAMLQYLAAN